MNTWNNDNSIVLPHLNYSPQHYFMSIIEDRSRLIEKARKMLEYNYCAPRLKFLFFLLLLKYIRKISEIFFLRPMPTSVCWIV